MARKPKARLRRKTARGSAPAPRSAAPNFATWRAEAAAELERRHGYKAGSIPHRAWTRWFIEGLSPEAAAVEAAASAHNVRSAADRLRGK
jgi:hypothetical protein